MKLRNKILISALLFFTFVLLPIFSTGAIWVQNAGLLPSTAVVFPSNSPAIDKMMASVFHGIYGNRVGICDGTADQVEINAAILAAYGIGTSYNGTKVLLRAGRFLINAPINVYNQSSPTPVWLDGEGWWTTRIDVAAGSNCDAIDCISNQTVGVPTGQIRVSDLTLFGARGFGDTVGNGFSANNTAGASYQTNDIQIDNVLAMNFPGDGFRINHGWGARISNCLSETNGGNGYTIDQYSYQSYLLNDFSQFNSHYGYSIGGFNHLLTNCHSSLDGYDGFYLAGLGQTNLSNSIARNWGQTTASTYAGIRVIGPYTSVTGCSVQGDATTKSYYGIAIGNGTDITITGCNIRGATRYGIYQYVWSGVVRINITGNTIDPTGMTAAIRNDSIATNVIIRGNPGYVTESSVSGNITTGTTSAVISHLCNYTPLVGDITIVFSNNATNAIGNWWVDTITSTQLTVHAANNPGASGQQFVAEIRRQ